MFYSEKDIDCIKRLMDSKCVKRGIEEANEYFQEFDNLPNVTDMVNDAIRDYESKKFRVVRVEVVEYGIVTMVLYSLDELVGEDEYRVIKYVHIENLEDLVHEIVGMVFSGWQMVKSHCEVREVQLKDYLKDVWGMK